MTSDQKLGVMFAAATALFWGLYGPMLEKSRSSPADVVQWSAFKPYVFIGVAYLVWGIVGGIVGMKLIPSTPDNFSFTGKYLPAMKWGFIAGSMGAFGALTLTYAMFKARNAGLVMPIVFGGAVSVTAIYKFILQRGTEGAHATDPRLWVGMVLIAIGIVLVAKYTPHVVPGKPAGGAPAHAAATTPPATASPHT